MAIPGVGLIFPADLLTAEGGVVPFSVTYTDNTDKRQATVAIEIDTSSSFNTANLITSTFANVAHNSTCRMATALADGTWYWRATATNVDGSTTSVVRSLTMNRHILRTLYQFENVAKYGPDWTKKRTLYQYENVAKYGPDWTKKRGLYQYENITDEPPFPYIERLSTTRASQGSVVTIYGNGFGAKAASDPANADRAARGYGGAVYLGAKQCGIVSWSWQQITFTVPVDAVSGAVFVRLLTPDPPGQRDSNLKGLEIYEAPPTTDTGLELFVCDKKHPNTILAQLDAAAEKSFYVQRNASGSGKFRISRLDSKGGNRSILDDQNFILCRLNGVDVLKWMIESRKPVYVDDSEEQWIEVSGRGNMAVLDQAIVYPEGMPHPTSLERTWADTRGAAIFLQLFNEAHVRGCFPYVTVDFTVDHDSLGMPWTDYTDVSFHTGTKLSKVAEKLGQSYGLFDLYMTPTFVLRAYKNPGRGTDLSDTVRFFKGQSILSHENHGDSTNIENVVLVEGDAAGVLEVTHDITPSVDHYGRREGYLQARNVPNDWTQLANYGKIKADKSGQLAWGISMSTDFAFHKPFDTYNLGDWIWVHIEPEGADTAGFDGKVRVVGATVTEDADLKLSAQLELNNIMLERELIMAQLLERLAMGSTDGQMTNPSETPPAGIAHNHFHGLLIGLADDDHKQYYNALRHASDLHGFLPRVTGLKKAGEAVLIGEVALAAGSNVTLVQDDVAKTITIAASGGGGGGGYANPIDQPPASPHSLDDEFDGPSLAAKWSWVNQGTAVASISDGVLNINAPKGGIACRGIAQPVPNSQDFTVVTKYLGCDYWGNYAKTGLLISESLTGKQLGIWHAYDVNWKGLMGEFFNHPTSRSTFAYHGPVVLPVSSYIKARIYYDVASWYVDFYYSTNGFNWVPSRAALALGFVPGHVGLGLDFEIGGSGTHDTMFDWFRVVEND